MPWLMIAAQHGISNMKKIYVTGLHRAGTHSAANYVAIQNDVENCIEEMTLYINGIEETADITRNNFRVTRINDKKKFDVHIKASLYKKIKNGFVLHCPGLAYQAKRLADAGNAVIWVTRNHDDVVSSMYHAGIFDMAFDLMKWLHYEYPDDPIWSKLTYDGSEDRHYGFVGYHTLLIKVSEYFYEKYMKNIVALHVTDDQPYYDRSKTKAAKHPLHVKQQDRIKSMSDYWNGIYEGLGTI